MLYFFNTENKKKNIYRHNNRNIFNVFMRQKIIRIIMKNEEKINLSGRDIEFIQ